MCDMAKRRVGYGRGGGRVKVRSWFLVLLLMCQPAMAGQRILLIRGLMDYVPGVSSMTLLKARLTDEGYDVTMITHLNDGFYKNQYWDAVIGHSQGAIDVSFPKISSVQIRVKRQNQRIIRRDACASSSACNVCR
jgi:hypothetical protein